MKMAAAFVFNKHLRLTLGLVYLALIPLYAFLYTQQDEGFYHTTVRFETSVQSDAAALAQRLTQAIVTQYQDFHRGCPDRC
jgi:hypothetical protein